MDTLLIETTIMYRIELRCEKCQNQHIKKYDNLAFHEVQICAQSMELDLLSCKILCEKCGATGPTRIRITDVYSEVFFEKIITAIPPYAKPNTISAFENFKKLGKDPCFLCKGDGAIEIVSKAHKYLDLKGINTDKCPQCLGKGYLSK